MKSALKTYEVKVNGKIHWIAATSKKVIHEFFYGQKATSIIHRPDVNPTTCNTTL